ncbi:MAG: DUF58 domain-containing protein [Bifidobacteriaceae bacterium]|jgi:uncharacterized protein (DUF58 family)|nr:DUF58 domain-containing protein [Bifidobacteriaceae bacterium]MCI1978874.1 DUF58 domain-containing protein [Bifidobacteriaceae bacterium]
MVTAPSSTPRTNRTVSASETGKATHPNRRSQPLLFCNFRHLDRLGLLGHINCLGRLAWRYISPLGWFTLAFSAICLTVGICLGWEEFAGMGVFGFSLSGGALLTSLGHIGLDAMLTLSHRRTAEGKDISAHIVFDNSGKRPTSTARAHIDFGTQTESFSLPSLKPDERAETSVTFTPSHRGVMTIGPLKIRKGDPLGLIHHERDVSGAQKLFVHPQTVTLSDIDSGSLRDLDGESTESIVDDDLAFYGLRDYQPGDDLRNVHWLTTARTRKLEVRQFQATRRTTVSLCIDLDPTDYRDPMEFEIAVSAYASIGAHCLVQSRPLISHSGKSHITHDSAPLFLDTCSALTQETESDSGLTTETVLHGRDSSLYIFVVGPLKTMNNLRETLMALPRPVHALLLRVDPHAQLCLCRERYFSRGVLPKLSDLPALLQLYGEGNSS